MIARLHHRGIVVAELNDAGQWNAEDEAMQIRLNTRFDPTDPDNRPIGEQHDGFGRPAARKAAMHFNLELELPSLSPIPHGAIS